MLDSDEQLKEEYMELFMKKDVVLCDLMGTDKRDKKKNARIMKKFLDNREKRLKFV